MDLFENFDLGLVEEKNLKENLGKKHATATSTTLNVAKKSEIKDSNFLKQKRLNQDDQPVQSKEFSILNQQNEDMIIEQKLVGLIDDKDLLKGSEEIGKMQFKDFFIKGCNHQVYIPKDQGFEFTERPLDKPFKTYPFVLDPFQQRSVLCLENNQSVLVAAHTSAGKTVVAEYAIAKAISQNQRVIYTSPIKALSNQKYRELSEEFKDVGLMTGDVTQNPNATCLVMTTEILRNMLYKGSQITREMAWVIFDEVHYMRDKDRGVVWEETMILLPEQVKYVFLSATIPNAKQFSQWIAKIKKQPCHVISTDFRPVPLQHYLFASGSNGIHCVVDEKGRFKEDNFKEALSYLEEGEKIKEMMKKKKDSKESDIKKLITLIKDQKLNPAIVFAFSKKDCESYALALSKIDFTSSTEKEEIEKVYLNAISTLSEEDQQLPQIKMMLPLIKQGVGIHHGGLLPIVKESIELLFQEGLIKLLFSTETFSMGINMPAKTVVFTNIEKWDGEEHRWLRGAEYIQMSGRAGRRGLDDKGITIMMLNKKMDLQICRDMLSGKSDPLLSSFKLSYNMIVNLIKIEGYTPDYMARHSFKQFQSEVSVPELIEEIILLRDENRKLKVDPNEELQVREINEIKTQINKNKEIVRSYILNPRYAVSRLCKGRLVEVTGFGWGVLVSAEKVNLEIKDIQKLIKAERKFYKEEDLKKLEKIDSIKLDVLLWIKDTVDNNRRIQSCPLDSNEGMLGVVPILYESLSNISKIKLNLESFNLKEDSSLNHIANVLKSAVKTQGKIEMDPINDYSIKEEELINAAKKIKIYENQLKNNKIEESLIKLYDVKVKLRKTLNSKINELSKLKETVLGEELEKRKKVLRHFDFITADDTVKSKGQVACLVSSTDELMLTEMLYHSQLNDIEPQFLAALLSCFLVDEKEDKDKEIENGVLKGLYERVKKSAERIADVLEEKRLITDKEKYVGSFKPDMVDAVLCWASGKSFGETCKKTTYFEGNVVRCIRRLDELIRQVSECAASIGNFSLKEKLDKASDLIKRGLIFAASLYTS